MNPKDKVTYWVENAEYDLQTAEVMHQSARYAYTAFMCQQALEKIMKGLYLQKTGEEAPRSHNLSYLIGLLNVNARESFINIFADLSSYYLEGRYPTYKEKISQLINKDKSLAIMAETREAFKWLKSRII